MNRKEHLLIGFISGIVLIFITHFLLGWFDYTLESICLYTIIIAIYCLLPDADHRNSTISFVFVGTSIIGMIVGYYYHNNQILFSSFALLVVTFIAWIVGHRGFIHSITFGILVSVPLIYFFSYQVAILAFVCFWSHLIADSEPFKLW